MAKFARKRFSKKPQKVVSDGTTYDSKFEYNMHTGPLAACKFHEHKIPYVVHHTYETDFTLEHEGTLYIIETKSFWRMGDVQKYKAIVAQLPENTKMIFVLSDKNKPVNKRVRKDGSRRTMEEDVLKSIKAHACFQSDEVGLLEKIKQV